LECVRSNRAEGAGKDKIGETATMSPPSQKEGTNPKNIGKCLPKSNKVLELEITSSKIGQYIIKCKT
jgi:hypothetical protein